MKKLSVIIPTLGRASLERTLRSCASADEVVVILDTARGGELPCALPPHAVYAEGHFGVTGGHAGRAYGIPLATGTHLAFMDDDDEYTPGAIELMRSGACERPVIFRMSHYAHGVLWRDPEIRFGNVSTQMYVVPNDPARFGSWHPHAPGLPEPGGDYTFIRETCEMMGAPVWREEITTVIRPEVLRRRPLVSVVTPWHNHPELVKDYLAAVAEVDEVVIVDNGSDPPLEFGSDDYISVVRSEENLGFSKGCNLGLQSASYGVVLFLNNDVKMLSSPWWINDIKAAVEPGVLVGPLIRHAKHAKVDDEEFPYIDGWCLAGMREDLLYLGGFDETLEEPAYYSDNLLCLEARAHGMTLRDVRVGLQHLANVTAGDQFSPSVQAAANANRAAYEARARELLAAV